jgi:medium-chain acyl-[acyl-carrier-protein] hydrolase
MVNLKDYSAITNDWITCFKPNPNAHLRLFFFPFGGSGASFYRSWVNGLPPEVELCAVQLPGREGRLREKSYTRLMPLVTVLSGIIETYLDIPFAFFGHSMGAWIGFELTRQLRREKKNSPIYLFASGRRAPQIESHEPPKHNLPKSEFINELRYYNGTPELIIQEPELLEIFLPILRADFSILETYKYTRDDSLDCPITVFGGLQDRAVSYEDLTAWKEQTCNEFRVKMFPGDHFYLKGARGQILREIAEDLKIFFNSDITQSPMP